MDVGDMRIEIIPFSGNVKYLGRTLTFDELDDTELDNRIAMGSDMHNDENDDPNHDPKTAMEVVKKPSICAGCKASRTESCERWMWSWMISRHLPRERRQMMCSSITCSLKCCETPSAMYSSSPRLAPRSTPKSNKLRDK